MPNRHRQLLVSRADLARLKTVSRGAVTLAARPGGPLAGAIVGDRIDRAHPDCRKWLGETDDTPTDIHFLDPSRVVTFEQLAEMAGVPLSEAPSLRQTFADATPIDFDHPVVQAFLAEHGVDR